VAEHAEIFTPQYAERSGAGSTLEFSAPYRAFVERFLAEHRDVCTVRDLGCGDGVVASGIAWGNVAYVGVDCIEGRVRRNRALYPRLSFECGDLRRSAAADLILVKDVIQHWATSEIQDWLRSFSGFRYALVTNCCYGDTINVDTWTGGWRAIDLTRPPFGRGEVVLSWGSPNKDVVLLRGDAR
jgi:hypothetical protein